MALKNQLTTCKPIDWNEFLLFIEFLKENKKYKLMLISSVVAYTGMKPNDALKLKWKDIINVNKIKINNDSPTLFNQIPIHNHLQLIINLCYDQVSGHINILNKYIFGNKHKGGGSVSIQYFNKITKDAFKSYGMINMSGNSSSQIFRKIFAHRFYQKNIHNINAILVLTNILTRHRYSFLNKVESNSIAILRGYLGYTNVVDEDYVKNLILSL